MALIESVYKNVFILKSHLYILFSYQRKISDTQIICKTETNRRIELYFRPATLQTIADFN